MRPVLVTLLTAILISGFSPALSQAGAPCPEVEAAKQLLEKHQVAWGVQTGIPETHPRGKAASTLAGATKKESDIQAPRGVQPEAIQAPRTLAGATKKESDIQAPRAAQPEAIQAPRTLAGAKAKPQFSKAQALIKQAEAACKQGKPAVAAEKAKAAMELLK